MKYLLLLFSIACFSQEYHIDKNDIKALRIYEVNTQQQADFLVFFVKDKTQADKNGCWFVGSRTPTSKPIRYVNFPDQADLRIYRVRIKEQAGCKKAG